MKGLNILHYLPLNYEVPKIPAISSLSSVLWFAVVYSTAFVNVPCNLGTENGGGVGSKGL